MTARMMTGFVVLGALATQGSKNGFAIYRGSEAKGTREFTGKIAMVETDLKLPAWRQLVKDAARASVGTYADAAEFPLRGPVRVCVTFSVPVPKRVPPERLGWPMVKPDVDKYVRAILDAITLAGNVWPDDGAAVEVRAAKVYGLLPAPGVIVELYAVDAVEAELAMEAARWSEPYMAFMNEFEVRETPA